MRVLFHRRCDKDLERLKAAGWNMKPFEQFLLDCVQWPLPKKYEAHQLMGDKDGIWDIHIRQNWIVFLKKEGSVIRLLRTGTHADLGI